MLNQPAIAAVLQRFKAGELTASQVEAWAEMIEGREDIDLDATAREAIFQLANPIINGPIAGVA